VIKLLIKYGEKNPAEAQRRASGQKQVSTVAAQISESAYQTGNE